MRSISRLPIPIRPSRDPVRRNTAPAPFLALLMSRSGLGLPERLSRLIWDMVSLSEDPEARAFCYSVRSLLTQVVQAPETTAAFDHWRTAIGKWLVPDLLHEALAELEQRELLAPHRCAVWHQRIRECTQADGQWKTAPSEPVNE